jgi:hypothetical protein
MTATNKGYSVIMEVLLGAGADVDAVTIQVSCCMHVVNSADSTLEHYRVVHLCHLNSCF